MAEESATTESTGQPNSGGGRRVILIIVLVLLVVGLIYDRAVARPKVDEAYERLTELHRITNRYGNPETMFGLQDFDEDGLLTGDEIAGRMRSDLEKIDTDGDGAISAAELQAQTTIAAADVMEAIGREPANEYEEGPEIVEIYHFASGIPFKSHKLYAAYRVRGDEKYFYRHAKYVFEKSSDIMADATTTVEVDEGATPLYGEEEAVLGGAGDGGGDGGGGSAPSGPTQYSAPPAEYSAPPTVYSAPPADDGSESTEGGAEAPGGAAGPGGRGFDPEARFAEADADQDGKLTGDEISGRMQENLARIDTDGDGEVTKEEFMALVEAMRARSGGQAGGPGGRGRPELESSEDESSGDQEQPEGADADQADESSGEDASADEGAESP